MSERRQYHDMGGLEAGATGSSHDLASEVESAVASRRCGTGGSMELSDGAGARIPLVGNDLRQPDATRALAPGQRAPAGAGPGSRRGEPLAEVSGTGF